MYLSLSRRSIKCFTCLLVLNVLSFLLLFLGFTQTAVDTERRLEGEQQLKESRNFPQVFVEIKNRSNVRLKDDNSLAFFPRPLRQIH